MLPEEPPPPTKSQPAAWLDARPSWELVLPPPLTRCILHLPTPCFSPPCLDTFFPAPLYLPDNSRSCCMTSATGWLKSQRLTTPNVGGEMEQRELGVRS